MKRSRIGHLVLGNKTANLFVEVNAKSEMHFIVRSPMDLSRAASRHEASPSQLVWRPALCRWVASIGAKRFDCDGRNQFACTEQVALAARRVTKRIDVGEAIDGRRAVDGGTARHHFRNLNALLHCLMMRGRIDRRVAIKG